MKHKVAAKLADLPMSPGVYFFKDVQGQIIYVGKAARLRNRVRSYFQKGRPQDTKTSLLIADIADIDWQPVETEDDALFLEAELVRRYRPHYNILLRDDKSAQYVRIDHKSDYPTLTLVRRPLPDGADYFGPFNDGWTVKQALRFLRRAFPYATSKPSGKRVRLQYHLGLDPGLEEGRTSLSDYRANLRKLMRYLRGGRTALVNQLEREMKSHARKSEFEEAARVRDQLKSLAALGRRHLLSSQELAESNRDHALTELAYLLGSGKPAQAMEADDSQGGGEKRSESYGQYDERAPQSATQRGAARIGGVVGSAGKQAGSFHGLRRIEGFDISHIQGSDNSASMVVFTFGVPDKTAYRKFKLRAPGNDDFVHMFEAISRRFSQTNIKKWGLPDLVLIDGGRGQLNAALRARDGAAQIAVPMIGLAKAEETIIVSNQKSLPGAEVDKLARRAKKLNSYLKTSNEYTEVLLPANAPAIKLLQRVRDESHRFALSYHSGLRAKRATASWLDELPGVGPATRKKLVKHFGSLRGAQQASKAEFQQLFGPRRGSMLHRQIAGKS